MNVGPLGRRPRRSAAVVAERSAGQVMLVDPAGERLITLNAVGSVLWGHLDGGRSALELVDVLGEAYPEQSREQLEADVVAFIDQLDAHGLLDDAPR